MKIHSRHDISGTLYDRDDNPVSKILLVGVNYTSNSNFNLFSVAMCLKHGWELNSNFDTGCILTKNGQEIRFDIRVKSGSGYPWVAKIVPDGTKDVSTANVEPSGGDALNNNDGNNESQLKDVKKNTMDKMTTLNVQASVIADKVVALSTNQKKRMCNGITRQYAHVLFGHAHVTSALATAKYLRYRICTDSTACRQILVCEGCAKAKARKKGVSLRGKKTHIKSTAPNAFIYMDTSTIRNAGGTKVRNGVWIGLVDEYSGMATSIFVAT